MIKSYNDFSTIKIKKIFYLKRGQIATEYLLLVGIALFAIMPIFYYSLSSSSETIRLNEADEFVNYIAKAADRVYSLGPGSQDYIQITVPGSTEEILFDRDEVIIKLSFRGKTSDVFAKSNANLIGYVSTSSGLKHVYVKTLPNGTVEIGELY